MKYFEDYKIGDTETTRGRTITETDIVNFCMFSGDWFPFHSNIEYAKNTPFGERIAHGMLILSVASGLMPTLQEMAILAFYGMDKVRFLEPVRINDTIHVEMTISHKEEKESGGVITMENRIKNQKNQDVVIAIQKGLVAKRPL